MGDRLALGAFLTVAAALVLVGCAAVGPNFQAPHGPVAAGYAGAGDRAAAIAVLSSDTRPSGPWWRAMGSRDLDAVMTLALAHNQTAAAAEATLERARAQAEREGARRYPTVAAAAAYERERINIASLGFSGFHSPTIGLYSIGPSVSYDLDVFGGQRRRIEAARATAQAQSFRADAAYLTLTGDVALEAVRIAGLRAEIETVEGVVTDDRHAIDIAAKAEAAGGQPVSVGLGGKLQLQEDLSLLPPLSQQLAQARHALALLVGEPPGDWSAPNFAVDGFAPPSIIPVAVPSLLVRRRPDIQAAEADLHADTAQIGVQTARLYPDIKLVAGLTQEALTPGPLFNSTSAAYNFGPIINAPLFDGGAIRADRRAALAQARAALAQYRQTVITAFVQVSDVLSALAQDDERLATLGRAETTARSSLDDSREAYRLGGAPLTDVVVADRQWRRASLAKVVAIGQRLADIVALYGATASDWRPPPARDPDPVGGKTWRPGGAKPLASTGQYP